MWLEGRHPIVDLGLGDTLEVILVVIVIVIPSLPAPPLGDLLWMLIHIH